MTSPRKEEAARRTRRLIVRITDEEQTRIRDGARDAGLPVSEYVRRLVVDGRIVIRRESAYGVSVAHQLRHIGVNINQQMAIAHLNGELPRDLTRLWAKLETLLDRMIRVTDREV
ncbi:MAG: hypothetical protein GC160_16235 [Acidobacteria bacterium]|nr:hypothetical protein [Acidobacteriota bacterium]